MHVGQDPGSSWSLEFLGHLWNSAEKRCGRQGLHIYGAVCLEPQCLVYIATTSPYLACQVAENSLEKLTPATLSALASVQALWYRDREGAAPDSSGSLTAMETHPPL